MSIIELISQYDSLLALHIHNHARRGVRVIRYHSLAVMEEFLDVMEKQV